jgi:hypothetical protein
MDDARPPVSLERRKPDRKFRYASAWSFVSVGPQVARGARQPAGKIEIMNSALCSLRIGVS